MLKPISTVSLLLIFFSLTLLSCEKEKVISEDDLPREIMTFIETNFPDSQVAQTNLDQETFSKHYEVILNNNVRLEFNENKAIVEIDGVTQLPDHVIPNKILNYVKTNYSNNVITDWELDDNQQQIELDNQTELEFDEEGNFLKIDH